MSDTTRLTSFPNKIDTFERVSDLSVQEGTYEKAKEYKKHIDSEEFDIAEQYLKDNEDLAACAINATMFNKHSDALVALEEKSLADRKFAENVSSESTNRLNGLETTLNDGLNRLDTELNTIHSEFSKASGSSSDNTVFLNTFLNGTSKHSAKIKGSSDILVSCNSDKDLIISAKQYSVIKDKWTPANYTYDDIKLYKVKRSIKLDKENNTIEIGLLGNNNVSPGPDVFPIIKILDVSGFISIGECIEIGAIFNVIPEKRYPLNSSFSSMFWQNGTVTDMTEYGQETFKSLPKIFINVDTVSFSGMIKTPTVTAELILTLYVDELKKI